MEPLEIRKLSGTYAVRRLQPDDAEMIYAFCKRNTQYYEYCGKDISIELIEHDMRLAPPGIPSEQKYYMGFFENATLVAVMDLVVGYPDRRCAFIGFFMMNAALQGMGTGSSIITEALDHLKHHGFARCMLGIDKDNPQSNHFWRKNGFEVVREVIQDEGTVLVAERQL